MMTFHQFLAVISAFCAYPTFAQTEGCNLAFRNNSETFATPNFPLSVSGTISCEWKITIRGGGSILLTLMSQLPEMTDPCQGSLKIYSGSGTTRTLQNTFCNGRMDHPFVLMNHQMTVVYETVATGGPSIQMNYTRAKGCRTTATTFGADTIKLPAYPAYFGLNTQCFWSITAYRTFVLRLTVKDFLLESSADCLFGTLAITDEVAGRESLWSTCESGTQPAKTFNTSIVGVYLELNTQKPAGMVIVYKDVIPLGPPTEPVETTIGPTTTSTIETTSSNVGCNRDFRENSGTFATPNFPDAVSGTLSCQWTITVHGGGSIMLTLLSPLLQVTDPCKGSLKIYRGSGTTRTLQNTFCNGRMDHPFVLMNHQMTVVYETVATGGPSIQMNYTRDQGCHATVNTFGADTIKLPANPAYFGLNMQCFWSITAHRTFVLRLTVKEFLLESSTDCLYGSLGFADEAAGRETLWFTCESGTQPAKTYNTSIVGVFLELNTQKPAGMIIAYKDVIPLDPPIESTGTTETTTSKQPEQNNESTTSDSTTTNKGDCSIQTFSLITLLAILSTVFISSN